MTFQYDFNKFSLYIIGMQLCSLTHYSPVLLFYTPWKHQKTFRFSDVFRGYRKAIPVCNGLNNSVFFVRILWRVFFQPITMALIRSVLLHQTCKFYLFISLFITDYIGVFWTLWNIQDWAFTENSERPHHTFLTGSWIRL